MAEKKKSKKKGASLWKKLAFILAVIAVIKELRTPKSQRDWHGKLAGFIPYDFRIPSWERIKETYWDPRGPIVADRVWGVGWTVNLGRLKKLVTS